MPYPTVVTDSAATQDKVNQFRTYASQLPDPAQAQIDADTKAYNDYVGKLGDVTQPATSSASPSSAAVSTSTAAPSSTSGVDWVRARVRPEYQPYVDQAVAAANKYGIDPNVYARQIFQESGFNPNAGSHEGAHGIAQFTTPTAQGYGINPWDPTQSLDAGARYMASNLKANGGDYRLALAAYNAGQGNVNRYGQSIFNAAYLKSQGWSDQDANQPSQYIAAILGQTSPTSAGQSDQAGPAAAQLGSGQSLGTGMDGGVLSGLSASTGSRANDPQSQDPNNQPPSPNDDLKEFSAYASSLGDPGGTSSFGSNPQDVTSPIDQARSQGQTGLPDFAGMASSALGSVGGLVASMLPQPQDQGFSLPSSSRAGPQPYNDMAGASSSPLPAFGSNPEDATSPIDQARNVQGVSSSPSPFTADWPSVTVPSANPAPKPLPQLLGGDQPLTDLGNQIIQGQQGRMADFHYRNTPTLGTRPDQPAREQVNRPYNPTDIQSGYTPSQLTAQAKAGADMALGTVGEVPKLVGRPLAPVAEAVAQRTPQVLGEAAPVAERAAVENPLATIHEMYNGPAPQPPPKSPAQVAKAAGDTFVRLMTDRGAPLANFQQDVAKTLGRPLRVNEMAAELSRLNPDMAARVKIQEGLQPALQAVGQENIPALSDYLTAKHNIDVAKSLGERTQTEALKVPLATTTAERQAQALNGRIRMYQRLRQDGVSAGDGTIVTHYDELIADTQKELGTVNKRALRQVTAADAQRAAEAQAKGQAVTANRQFSGGINQTESQQALIQLQQVLGPDRFTKVEQAAQQVWKFADGIRQQAVDSGLWTPELANELRQDYPHYVPTKIIDYMQEPGAIANGSSLSVRDQGLKRLTIEGTDKLREDPLASLVRSQYQMEALAGKNRAFNAFVRLNQRLPEEDRLIREVPDSYTATVHDAKVSGFIDGKRVTYAMPKEFETVVKQEANPPIRGLSTAMQLYKSLLTSKNPAFIAGQVPLDAMSYVIREATRGGGPQALPGVLKALLSAYGDAWKGFGTQTFHGNTAEFLKGGGGMGGFFRNESSAVREGVAELARPSPLTINSTSDAMRIAKGVLTLKPVEAVGERFELAPRVASMKLAQQRGANNVQAVINGRTVTMDFAQGGSLAKQINQFIPFFNVGMQGLATPARVIRDNPKAALGSFLTLLAAPTIGAEAWNNADPQRAKDYADVPNYIKDRSIVLMLPVAAPTDQQAERRPQYIEIRAREFAPFVDLTRTALQTALGTNTRSWQDLAGGASNASSPISVDSPLGLFGGLVPPPLSTGVELATNRDFYRGSNITSKGADARASGLSQAAANGIFGATGVNARPSQVEFATGDLAGGVGAIARDVSNLGRPSQGTPQTIPLAGQVIRRFVGGSVGQRLQSAQDQRISDATRPILRDAGIYDITPVADHIGKIPLSNDEQAIYQETANRSITTLLSSAARSPTYQKLSPPEKAAMLQKMMDDMRTLAAKYTLTQIDEAGLKNRLRAQFQAETAAKAGAGR